MRPDELKASYERNGPVVVQTMWADQAFVEAYHDREENRERIYRTVRAMRSAPPPPQEQPCPTLRV